MQAYMQHTFSTHAACMQHLWNIQGLPASSALFGATPVRVAHVCCGRVCVRACVDGRACMRRPCTLRATLHWRCGLARFTCSGWCCDVAAVIGRLSYVGSRYDDDDDDLGSTDQSGLGSSARSIIAENDAITIKPDVATQPMYATVESGSTETITTVITDSVENDAHSMARW